MTTFILSLLFWFLCRGILLLLVIFMLSCKVIEVRHAGECCRGTYGADKRVMRVRIMVNIIIIIIIMMVIIIIAVV